MYLFSNFQITKSNFLSFLLALTPLSFIAGNMIININISLIIIFALFFYGKDILRLKYFFLDYLLILFFFLILFTGVINDLYFFSIKLAWKGYFATIIKSLFFFRYLILYFVLRFLIERNILDLKSFLISCAAASLFVSLDLFYQFLNGHDLFGFSGKGNKLGGPFGDELIAGGFLQRFSIFSFFIIPLFYSKKLSKFLILIIPVLFIIFLMGIILSGNRMPLLLFLLSFFLIIIFQKQTRKFFFHFAIIFIITFLLILNFNPKIKDYFSSFYFQISQMTILVANKDFNDQNSPPYLKEFSTFYETWLMHKYIGGGIKNFRYYCHHRKHINKNSKFVCNMHPHNYYLEILTETGLIGFLLISSVFLIILYLSFYKKYFARSPVQFNNIIIPFIFLFIVEIFPLKSTGSFFTTGNTTYLFLIMGILIGLTRKDIFIENKN
tara:strand:- start:1073 stop:2389 length:1317 start_codon:yes stop_codon:yes gene_type:complete